MAYRHFPGKSQEWLEAKLSELLDEKAAGKVSTSVGAGDVNVTKRVETSIDARVQMILHDLHILDPDTYPAAAIRRPNATTGIFRD